MRERGLKILFVSLGCDKNLVDSEEMLADLVEAGYAITDDEEAAQAAVVNTCCFIGDAKEESIATILELGKRRLSGQLRALIVAGCLAQRYSEDILREIPEVDAVIGTTAQETLPGMLQSILGRPQAPARTAGCGEAGPAPVKGISCAQVPVEDAPGGDLAGGKAPGGGAPGLDGPSGEKSPGACQEGEADALAGRRDRIRLYDLGKKPRADARRVLTTLAGYAYLRIAEGCDKRCTYCVIPSIRGPYRSLPMDQILGTARELAGQGARELILVAQETTLYGTDLYGENRFPALLRALAQLEDVRWIRILYAYPEEITPALVAAIRDEPKVLHYLDMPIQHASDAILQKMGRRTTRKELEEKIALLRREIPDICLRTTLIAGFPGETEKDHKALVSFVRRMKFDRLGVFAYSREEGTPAAKMKGQIPAPVKKKRRRELMLLQQDIAFRKARRMKGRVLEAIVEGRIAGEDVYTARTYMDAPGVDGTLFIETGRELMTGDFVRVRIVGSDHYDLIGSLEETL